jgi:hypothetical protein
MTSLQLTAVNRFEQKKVKARCQLPREGQPMLKNKERTTLEMPDNDEHSQRRQSHD